MALTDDEKKMAAYIDHDLLYLAPECSIGEYLIEKGYVVVVSDDDDDT